MRDDEKQMLSSTHKEADERVFLLTTVAIRNESERVIVCASDTDIVVIALFHLNSFERMGFRILIQSKGYYIPIHKLVHRFSENERDMLHLLHAVSGYDTNGFLFGKGKRAFMKAVGELKKESELAGFCRGIIENMNREKNKIKALVTKLFVKLYTKSDKFDTLNAVRAHVYYGGRKYLETLPPTDDALQHHDLRAIFQAFIWVLALKPKPEIGWRSDSGSTKPVFIINKSAPANLAVDNFCKCKKIMH